MVKLAEERGRREVYTDRLWLPVSSVLPAPQLLDIDVDGSANGLESSNHSLEAEDSIWEVLVPCEAVYIFLSSPRSTLLHPALPSHAVLHPTPDALHNLSISPPTLHPQTAVPLVNLRTHDPSSPAFHCPRNLLSSPSYINPQSVFKQIRRLLPFVALELPGLSGGKYSNHTVPVVGLELFRGVDENET